jgi:hypothetical protein
LLFAHLLHFSFPSVITLLAVAVALFQGLLIALLAVAVALFQGLLIPSFFLQTLKYPSVLNSILIQL